MLKIINKLLKCLKHKNNKHNMTKCCLYFKQRIILDKIDYLLQLMNKQ